MPRITRLVVCGRLLVIATLAPTRALVRVDLPTFGRPTRHAKPDLKTGSRGAGLAAAPVPRARPAFFSVTRGWFTRQLSCIRVTRWVAAAITETIFIAENFRSHSVKKFLIEKSFPNYRMRRAEERESPERPRLRAGLRRLPGLRGNVWFVTPTPIWRPTARILLADPEGRLLLFSAREADGERWWFTPGGGVHRGETVQGAAVREVYEET